MLPSILIFGERISTYWMTMAIGFIAMVILMVRRKKIYALSTTRAIAVASMVMFSGVLGCKLLYMAENLSEIRTNGLTLGGFSFFGAVFLVPIVMACSGKLFGLNVGTSTDAAAPCVSLMVAVIRFGCYLNGCCGGTQFIIGLRTFTWPTQMMESIGDILITAWLLGMESSGDSGGKLYERFLLSYGALRFFIEFFRDTPKDWLGLSHGQCFSVASVVVALGCIVFQRGKGDYRFFQRKEEVTNEKM